MDLIAHVPRDLADLLPTFRQNRQQEVDSLKQALATADLQQIRELGERMYAVGNPYGFRQITTFGRQIRDACEAQDVGAIVNVIGQYETYLARVSVSVVDAAPTRVQWSVPQPPWATKAQGGESDRGP